jgi:hypothetical protein
MNLARQALPGRRLYHPIVPEGRLTDLIGGHRPSVQSFSIVLPGLFLWIAPLPGSFCRLNSCGPSDRGEQLQRA